MKSLKEIRLMFLSLYLPLMNYSKVQNPTRFHNFLFIFFWRMIDLFRNTEVLYSGQRKWKINMKYLLDHMHYSITMIIIRWSGMQKIIMFSKRNLDLSNLRQNWMSNYFFVYSCMYQDQLSNYVLQKIRLGSEFDNIIFCLRCWWKIFCGWQTWSWNCNGNRKG